MDEHPPPLEMVRLVADHHAAVYGFAYRLTGSVHDAEDLTQQAFLVAQVRLGQVRQAESVRSWLFAIVRNACLKLRRRRSPLAAVDVDLNVDAIPDEVPAESAVDSERLQAALNGLPEEFRVVLVMFYYQGAPYRQIAAELELPLGTVMSRLSRAKAHLRARLFEPKLAHSGSGEQ